MSTITLVIFAGLAFYRSKLTFGAIVHSPQVIPISIDSSAMAGTTESFRTKNGRNL
jgi:hypothetical protein